MSSDSGNDVFSDCPGPISRGEKMGAGNPPGPTQEELTPAEREARWELRVHLAIQAAGEEEARTVLAYALAELQPELRLRDTPVIRPRHPIRDNVWVAVLEPDLTHLQVLEPDNAPTRCSFAMGLFPKVTGWTMPLNCEREARREWPPDIWHSQPEKEDAPLHPAVRAVMISCKVKQAQ